MLVTINILLNLGAMIIFFLAQASERINQSKQKQNNVKTATKTSAEDKVVFFGR